MEIRLNEEKNKVNAKRKNRGVKFGYGKGSNNANELDKFKDLKKHNFRFKRKIKSIKKNVAHENDDDKGGDNDKN